MENKLFEVMGFVSFTAISPEPRTAGLLLVVGRQAVFVHGINNHHHSKCLNAFHDQLWD